MKRQLARKLRDRRSGKSPYARHGKREYEYSANYRAWKHANDERTASGKSRDAVQTS
jgi:hypothetical protein